MRPSAGLSASRSVGRRFGIEIGGVTLIAAAILFSRHRAFAAASLVVLGAVLVATAVIRPRILDPAARRWLAVGGTLARFTTPFVLTILFFALVTPMGFLRRRLSRSPIERDPKSPSYWVPRPPRSKEAARSAMEHQF
jgi:hypothetical protein